MIRKYKIEIGLMLIIAVSMGLSASFANSVENNSGILNPIDLNQAYVTSMPYIDNSSVIIDGTINSAEYGQIYVNEHTGITVSWEYNDDNMSIGLEATTTGWIALGFGTGMEDSNILMVGVTDSGDAYCYDIIGLPGFTHTDDTDQGGTDNIVACQGSESNGYTMVEFVFSFTPVDGLDPIPEQGTIANFFLGLNEDSDDKMRIHDIYESNLNLYYKPPTLNVETNLVLSAPETVYQEETFEVMVLVRDTNSNPISNVTVSVGYKTTFGNYIMKIEQSNGQGQLTVDLYFDNVLGPITLIAISQEMITISEDANIAYLGSIGQMEIKVEGDAINEEPEYVVTSRWALVAGFWLIGIIIWTTFGYNFYAIIQIFRHRNDPVDDEEHDHTSKMEETI